MKEEMQSICGNMIGTEDENEIVIYKCKHYGCRPPCHERLDSPCYVDLYDCKHRIIVTPEEYMAQFKNNKEGNK